MLLPPPHDRNAFWPAASHFVRHFSAGASGFAQVISAVLLATDYIAKLQHMRTVVTRSEFRV